MRKLPYNFTQQDNGIVKPKIPVRIINPETGDSLVVNALLDSGADSCLLPAMIAMTLGLKLDSDSEAKGHTIGISGEKLKTWKHLVRMELLDNSWQSTEKILDVIVSVLEPKVTIQAIAGTSMFLDNFVVTLNYKSNLIHLEY